jgi:hypothetical protein
MMASPATWLILGAILVLPVASVAAVWFATRRLARTGSVPPWAVWTGYGLTVPGALVLVLGTISGIIVSMGAVSGDSVDPSQKARRLAEGISEAMNCGALALLVAVFGGAFVAIVRWRWGRRG